MSTTLTTGDTVAVTQPHKGFNPFGVYLIVAIDEDNLATLAPYDDTAATIGTIPLADLRPEQP